VHLVDDSDFMKLLVFELLETQKSLRKILNLIGALFEPANRVSYWL